MGRDHALGGAKHRQGSRAAVRARLKQIPDQACDPFDRESVGAPRAPILGGLPANKYLERLSIVGVELKVRTCQVPLELTLLVKGGFEDFLRGRLPLG